MSEIRLILGDALQILPTLGGVDAVIADPPYGTANNCDYTRFTGGRRVNDALRQGIVHPPIRNDHEPFDPMPFLRFKRCVLWGANNFSDRLPQGAWFVWDKKDRGLEGQFMSDAEVAWSKSGCGVFLFRHVWDGFNRQSERGEHYHPTQKPIALMRWCLERISKPGDTIFDPYAGSGTVALACLQTGRNCIACEIDPTYYEIARKRIEAAQNAAPLFEPARPVQAEMFSLAQSSEK